METMNQSSSGALVGQFWIELDDMPFPDTGWSDFAVVVLSWWNNSVASILQESRCKRKFEFMDGPYLFQATKNGSDLIGIELVQEGAQRNYVRGQGTISELLLAAEIAAASNALLSTCNEHKWRAKDIDDLKASTARLHDLIAQQ